MSNEAHEALDLIAAERKRQVEVEGWKPEHDDGETSGELARAAAAYALPEDDRALQRSHHGWPDNEPPFGWPWAYRDWKPTPDDRVRELVKAGALIVAEIERLQRLGGVS